MYKFIPRADKHLIHYFFVRSKQINEIFELIFKISKKKLRKFLSLIYTKKESTLKKNID